MATTKTLTGDLETLLDDANFATLRVWVTFDQPRLTDPDNGKTKLGAIEVIRDEDTATTFSAALPDNSWDPSPHWYRLHVQYRTLSFGTLEKWVSREFQMDVDKDLAALPTELPRAVDEAEYATFFDLIDQADAASIAAAEAQAAAEEARDGAVAVATGDLVPALGALGLPQSGADLSASNAEAIEDDESLPGIAVREVVREVGDLVYLTQSDGLVPRGRVPDRPKQTVLAAYGSGVGTSSTWNKSDTWNGEPCASITLAAGDTASKDIDIAVSNIIDPTGKSFALVAVVDNASQIDNIDLFLGTTSGFSNSNHLYMYPPDGGPVDVNVKNSFTSHRGKFGANVGTGMGTAPGFVRVRVKGRTSHTGATVRIFAVTAWTPRPTTGIACVTVDDSITNIRNVAQVMNARMLPYTAFPIMDGLTSDDFAWLREQEQVYSARVGAHSMSSATHTANWSGNPLGPANELAALRSVQLQQRLTGECCAYPGGTSDTATRQIVQGFYSASRATGVEYETMPPAKAAALRSPSLGSAVSLATAQGWSTIAANGPGLLVVTAHGLVTSGPGTFEWTKADFASWVDDALSKGLTFMSLDAAMRSM